MMFIMELLKLKGERKFEKIVNVILLKVFYVEQSNKINSAQVA